MNSQARLTQQPSTYSLDNMTQTKENHVVVEVTGVIEYRNASGEVIATTDITTSLPLDAAPTLLENEHGLDL